MGKTLRFYFDFASPYAYFAAGEIGRIGTEFDIDVEWRPMLLWAIFRRHGMATPMNTPARKAYLLQDMARSAQYYQLPYVHPPKFPISTHLAARLFYTLALRDSAQAENFARAALDAYFAKKQDISDEAVVSEIARAADVREEDAIDGMKAPDARTRLEIAVEEAIGDGVIGSPFFLVDGESFFGADRLPQLRWYLSGGCR